MSNKKDGLEIFELFRHGAPKNASPEAPTPPAPPAPKERVTAVRQAPAPRPEPKPEPVERAEATLTVRVNTALFGLMIGTACLFGTFALGVQFERRHRPATAAVPTDDARTAAVDEVPPAQLPGVIHETRREPAPNPPAPQNNETRPQPPAEAKKGFTLQLFAYPADQESTAQSMIARIQGQADGKDATLVKDKQGNFVVVGGFVEKRDGQEAEALMARYRRLAATMRKQFNLDWISMSR